jgi:protein-S-isoprenylcysteine O-methyltransferase Ste14
MKFSAWLPTIAPFPVSLCVVAFQSPPDWGAVDLVALALLWSSVLLLTRARLQLGNAFTVTPSATTLVTHGLYSRIRNPIYVFGTLHILAIALLLRRPLLYYALPLVVVIQLLRARAESRALEARFGDEYRAYKARTWF